MIFQEVEISNAGFLQESYIKENNIKNYLSLALEEAIVESYLEINNSQEYVTDPVITNSQGEIEFNNLASDLDSNFLEKVKEKFEISFLKYHFEEEVGKDNFEITFEDGVFNVVLDEIILKESFEDISWAYTFSPQAFSSLNKLGLEDFEAIYNAKEDCKNQENVQDCMSNLLSNFNIVVENKENLFSDKEYRLVKVSSKRNFLINNNFEKIKFEFVLK